MTARALFSAVALLALSCSPHAFAQPADPPSVFELEGPEPSPEPKASPSEPERPAQNAVPPQPLLPDARSAHPPQGHAPSHEKAKGPRGMMGNPWPKTPEEAEKTISNLMAHLATTDDRLLAGEIAVSVEKLWRLPGGDTVNLLIDRAALFASKNELDKALKLLDAASELSPDYPEVWNRRAYVFYRMENTSAALGDLRRTLALQPEHFRALDGMAKILESLGEKKAALKAYDQLLKLYPEIEGASESADKLRKEVDGRGI